MGPHHIIALHDPSSEFITISLTMNPKYSKYSGAWQKKMQFCDLKLCLRERNRSINSSANKIIYIITHCTHVKHQQSQFTATSLPFMPRKLTVALNMSLKLNLLVISGKKDSFSQIFIHYRNTQTLHRLAVLVLSF